MNSFVTSVPLITKGLRTSSVGDTRLLANESEATTQWCLRV